MTNPTNHEEYRGRMIQALKRELLGPETGDENENEVITISPLQSYGTGILFPSKIEQNSLEDESLKDAYEGVNVQTDEVKDKGDGGELYEPIESANNRKRSSSINALDNNPEEGSLNLANEYSPSALGLTFRCKKLDGLKIEVSFGTYTRKTVIEPHFKAGEQRADGTFYPLDQEKIVYQRVPREEIIDHQFDNVKFKTTKKITVPNSYKKLLIVITARPSTQGDYIVTAMVVNRIKLKRGVSPSYDNCFYQVKLVISSKGEKSIFSHIDRPSGTSEEDEIESLDLLYRHRKSFGLGHGCACDWSKDVIVEETGLTNKVWTACVPLYEVKPIFPRTSPYSVGSLDLSMAFLSDGREEDGNGSITRSLHDLCDDYENWIKDQLSIVSQLEARFKNAANRHLDNCNKCLSRMREGVEILEKDSDANPLLAFRIANKAMQMQRFHSELPKRELGSSYPTVPLNYANKEFKPTWRPFQLAFLLMNIAGIIDTGHEDRDIVDLIWFPTGGGKTEAYLGLSAFVIAYRRLCNHSDGGTAIIMRYTLRLLTAQQFQRASALTIAMDKLRTDKYLDAELGQDPISIGLWVGKSLSPNKIADARIALKNMKRNPNVMNPFQVLQCPWCGCKMDDKEKYGYYETRSEIDNTKTVKLKCPDESCDWGKKEVYLPISVIDEDLYKNPPTFLLGTVDKFAQLSWNDDVGAFFGVNNKNSAPSLIIQDELHLISGPLGTIVGLYETAIDRLCCLKGIPPKIIASSATIRRSSEQCKALYAREAFEFPPQALRAGESYFAFENNAAPGRIYVGVLGTALKSHSTSQVRVCSALLQAAVPDPEHDDHQNRKNVTDTTKKIISDPRTSNQDIQEPYMEEGTFFSEADPYGTLVWYFSSLRELGHAATFCTGDIPEYMKSVCRRLGIPFDYRRRIRNPIELTSRRTADEIPKILEQLELKWSPKPTGQYPVDVLLATNMISVGVDVSRLGLMVVTGQPKNSSEYIQASSRVGRKYPGLVVTVYNQGKSRDRSHYEQFVPYHQSFYRFVEATSITPFSSPARERGLRGLLVALARHVARLDKPENIALAKPLVQKEIKYILERISIIDPEEEDDAAKELNEALVNWQHITPAIYGKMGGSVDTTTLIYPYGKEPDQNFQEKSWPVLTSMRNVDKAAEAKVIPQYVVSVDEQ